MRRESRPLLGRRSFLCSAAGLTALPLLDLFWQRRFSLGTAAQGLDDRYSGFIILRLSPQANRTAVDKAPDLRRAAELMVSRELTAVLNSYPNVAAPRLVTTITVDQIGELERRAAGRGFKLRRSLNLYWRIDAREVADPEGFVRLLSKVPLVDRAYRELNVGDPAVNASDDQHSGLQRYLDAAPHGIDARWAWTRPGGAGEGVGFVDIEQGWLVHVAAEPNSIQHEDLLAPRQASAVSREMRPVDACPPSRHHGAAVLGIVTGKDNDRGIVGIAPNVAWMDVASHYRNGTQGHVVDAISTIVKHMSAGDVLLLEVYGFPNHPIEMDDGVFDAIQLATGLGITVVEPAGNGGIDLNLVPDFAPGNNVESGAIMVGAGESQLDATGTGHDRWVMQVADFSLPGPIPAFLRDCGYDKVPPPPLPASNHGARVNCYAAGEAVTSTGYGWLAGTSPATSYTNRFSGTSAAAAIIAGAAIALQGIHKAAKNAPLSPASLRTALSTHGTSQGMGVPGHIGVMPSLKEAATALGISGAAPPNHPTNIRINK